MTNEANMGAQGQMSAFQAQGNDMCRFLPTAYIYNPIANQSAYGTKAEGGAAGKAGDNGKRATGAYPSNSSVPVSVPVADPAQRNADPYRNVNPPGAGQAPAYIPYLYPNADKEYAYPPGMYPAFEFGGMFPPNYAYYPYPDPSYLASMGGMSPEGYQQYLWQAPQSVLQQTRAGPQAEAPVTSQGEQPHVEKKGTKSAKEEKTEK